MASPDIPENHGIFRFRRPLSTHYAVNAVIHSLVLPSPEQLAVQETELARHRGIVARGVLDFTDRWDKIVADRIGFPGNIRQTLFAHRQKLREGSTIKGLEPFLDLKKLKFCVGSNVLTDSPLKEFSIDFSEGPYERNFDPFLFFHLRDESLLRIKVNTGPTEDDYSHLHITRSKRGVIKGIRTFSLNHLAEDRPDHPVVIQPVERTEAYFEGISPRGNTTLRFWTGKSSGEYIGRNHQMPFVGGHIINQLEGKSGVTLGGNVRFVDFNGRPCKIPTNTNLYYEILKLVPSMKFPGLFKN